MMMMRQQQQQQQQQHYQQPLAAPSEPRPIPLNNGGSRRPSSNRLHTATSSSELLSKSLGDMPNLATELLRCSSAVSGIKHRGYLLKRSNHPYRAADEEKIDRCLFPTDGGVNSSNNHNHNNDGWNVFETTGMNEISSLSSTAAAMLHPKPHRWGGAMEDEHAASTSSWNYSSTIGPSYQHPSDFDVIMPHKPQHVMNQEQESAQILMPPLPTLWQNGVEHRSYVTSQPLDELAAFFGMRDGVAKPYQEQLALEPTILVPTNLVDPDSLNAKVQALLLPPTMSHSILIAPQIKRSSPISFARSAAPVAYAYDLDDDDDDQQHDNANNVNNTESNGSSDFHFHNRRMSAPSSSSSSGDLPPSDIVDPNDGHLWRSKYCILEDGVLYFYRNKYEGESPEARIERNNSRSGFDDGYDLSKSPMPRPSRLLAMTTSQDNNHHNLNNNNSNNQYLWEKRVALENVGAVRSAELEFGPNSFELLANINDDEDDDDSGKRSRLEDEEDDRNENKLILRAASQSEMQEWLFQFHRSVATYFMKLVEGISSSHQNNFMDLHHPSFQPPMMAAAPISPSQHGSPNLIGSFALSAFSPRLRKPLVPVPMATPMSTSLSHGHGRIAIRRRRVDDRPKSSSSAASTDSKARNYRDVSPGESTPDQEAMQIPFSMTPSEEPGLVPDSVFHPRILPALPSPTETSPEISAPVSICPETERPRPATTGKYIPPHLRNQQQQNGSSNNSSSNVSGNKYVPPSVRRRQLEQQQLAAAKALSLQERAALTPLHQPSNQEDAYSEISTDPTQTPWEQSPAAALSVGVPLKLGGCADPLVAVGSILDTIYTSKKASKVGKVYTEPFGCLSGDAVCSSTNNRGVAKLGGLQWEIGAVSECGVRESNEDSYVIAADLHLMLESLRDDSSASSSSGTTEQTKDKASSSHNSLFAVFDGHCGNQAARFAAEKLPTFIRDQYSVDGVFVGSFGGPLEIEDALRSALVRLDQDFCRLCVEGGRDWESGSTALVAVLANENLVIANLGDCRGVVCRCVDDSDSRVISRLKEDGWEKLNIHSKLNDSDDEDEDVKWMRAVGTEIEEDDDELPKKPAAKTCYWRLVTDVHSPAKAEERARIEGANGWITTETEIPIGQYQRMDFLDEDVIEILRRCLSDSCNQSKAAPQRILQIARVCGELAVSRAIGDRDFKAAYNQKSESGSENGDGWDCPLFLPYPDEHNKSFVGDLVSGMPDFDTLRVGEPGVSDEFLLLACDGLWDVLDPDDAVNITRGLLFNKKISAKRAAARLAELAIHLGSSDNITVIVVRFFRNES